MDEPRLREQALYQRHAADVAGGLVAPPGFAKSLGIDFENRSEGSAQIERPYGPDPLSQHLVVDLKIPPAVVSEDLLEEAFRGVGGGPTGPRHRWNEHRFGRYGDVGVGVEHEPKKGRSGASGPDDERDWNPVRAGSRLV